MTFALLPLAGLNLWRRNRQRTLLTMLAIMTATMVFSSVMVIPYAMTAIVNKADAVPRLAVTNRASIFRGLPDSYYRKRLTQSDRGVSGHLYLFFPK